VGITIILGNFRAWNFQLQNGLTIDLCHSQRAKKKGKEKEKQSLAAI